MNRRPLLLVLFGALLYHVMQRLAFRADLPLMCLHRGQSVSFAGSSRGHVTGSCFCSDVDNYCMCTPSLAVDMLAVAEYDQGDGNHVEFAVLIKRGHAPFGNALPGGFVEIGETVEAAAQREFFEETGLRCASPPRLIGVYSRVDRDPRRPTATIAYTCTLPRGANPKAGDDAKQAVLMRTDKLLDEPDAYIADHADIIADFMRAKRHGA